jgi:hypothetical protein
MLLKDFSLRGFTIHEMQGIIVGVYEINTEAHSSRIPAQPNIGDSRI